MARRSILARPARIGAVLVLAAFPSAAQDETDCPPPPRLQVSQETQPGTPKPMLLTTVPEPEASTLR